MNELDLINEKLDQLSTNEIINIAEAELEKIDNSLLNAIDTSLIDTIKKFHCTYMYLVNHSNQVDDIKVSQKDLENCSMLSIVYNYLKVREDFNKFIDLYYKREESNI